LKGRLTTEKKFEERRIKEKLNDYRILGKLKDRRTKGDHEMDKKIEIKTKGKLEVNEKLKA